MKIKLLASLIGIVFIVQCCTIPTEQKNNKDKYSNLAYLCKIWGFLKYYHPEVGGSSINWDSTLLVHLEKIRNTNNPDSIKIIFDKLILPYNDVSKNLPICDTDSLFTLNQEVQWIYDTICILPKSSEKLINLLKPKEYNNKYISANKWAKNPIFDSDTSYNSIVFPNENLRLLSLFRYWNIINYYFPYKYLTDHNWDRVLEMFIPRMLDVNDPIDYHLAICELSAMINENHAYTSSSILSAHWGENFLPVKFEEIDDKTVVSVIYSDSLAELNDLMLGDIILEINSIAIDVIRDSLQCYFSGSHKEAVQHIVSYYLSRSPDTCMNLKVIRDNSIYNISSIAYPREIIRNCRMSKIQPEIIIKHNNGITYIDLGKIRYNDIDSIIYSVLDSRALILDLRNNCNSFVHNMCEILFERREEFFIILRPCYNMPGFYCFVDGDSTGPNNTNFNHFNGEILVLVNYRTQSIGEFTSMALMKYPKTTIVGSKTAGADGNVSFINLPGGITTAISGIGIYWPDGTQTQRIGILPDITIKRTIESIKNEEDIVLKKALIYSNKLVRQQ